jgi:CSLREA domain-containing protein
MTARFAIVLLAFGTAAGAADFTVTRFDDPAPGACDEDCSLREAVIAANTTPSADTIALPAGEYRLAIKGANEDGAAMGDLDVADHLTISGTGGVVIRGKKDRVFDVRPGGSLTLNDLTVTGGKVKMRGGTESQNSGGGIQNSGDLVLNRVVVSGNKANDDGGGIDNDGTARLTDSLVSKNKTHDDAGGIDNDAGTITLERCALIGNKAGDEGGALENENAADLVNVTVSGNKAESDAGGLSNDGAGVMTLRNVTVSGNKAKRGAGISADENEGGRVVLANTIVAGNGKKKTTQCAGPVDALADSIAPDGTCGAAITADPLLGPLADNGGPTPTHALQPGSAAINTGRNGVCPDEDQRGLPRPKTLENPCDMGAFEVQP